MPNVQEASIRMKPQVFVLCVTLESTVWRGRQDALHVQLESTRQWKENPVAVSARLENFPPVAQPAVAHATQGRTQGWKAEHARHVLRGVTQ